jgi:hypothetical protein
MKVFRASAARAVAVAAAMSVATFSPQPVAAVPTSAMSIEAVGDLRTFVTGSRQLAVRGDAELGVGVVNAHGGSLRVVAGPSDELPRAISFPSSADSGVSPRAVVRLNAGAGGALSPRASGFTFGAVLRASGRPGGDTAHQGDNVFQRGRYADSAMFKLQIDDGRASCVVRGRAGRVMVRSSVSLAAGVWHRVTCSRFGPRLVVQVARYASGEVIDRSTTSGATGDVAFASSIPASIGGKLRASGRLAADTDQFNGDIASVWTKRYLGARQPGQS